METPSVAIRRPPAPELAVPNPLPTLLQTPAGLALLELQGTINLPAPATAEAAHAPGQTTPIGRICFPDYDPAGSGSDDTAWMQRVHLYVGSHQRLTGEVKKLPKPIAVVRRAAGPTSDLDVVEVIRYKLLFSQRPEPMTTG